MYSVFNVQVIYSSFKQKTVLYKEGYVTVAYGFKPIIRGSSTVNGDSAHSDDNLAREHNYVSFYVRSIEVIYELVFTGTSSVVLDPQSPVHVILFKVPYKDDQELESSLITNRIDGMILYSHPECVLAYDVISFIRKATDTHLLRCKKPFVVGPNDYVGILYYIPTNKPYLFKVDGIAKVVFKPQ